MTRFSLTLVAVLSQFMLVAQNEQRPFHGCHHSHNKSKRSTPLSERELQMMNETIARSDSFDVLNYAIHIDVTDYAGQSISAATSIQFVPLMNNQSYVRFDLFNYKFKS